MPPTHKWSESRRCLFYGVKSSIIHPSSLPQPKSEDLKGGGLWYEDHTGQHFSGGKWAPHTVHKVNLLPPKAWPLGPGSQKEAANFGPVYTAQLQDSPQLQPDPQADPWAHREARNSPPCNYLHFPLLLPLLPGPSEGKARASLATERLKLNLLGL